MQKRILWILIPAFLSLTIGLLPSNKVGAHPVQIQPSTSAFDLIVAVNDLRASNGLPAYNVSSILMGTAQGQAEYMASIGSWSHEGPGGISYSQRLLNAGYPLAGGFRAENVLVVSAKTSGYDIVHSAYWADADHQNTMLSVNLTEIGAGIAVKDGMGYYVIDCARSSTSGGSTTSGNAPAGGTPATQGPSQILSAVVVSTPREDGAIYHEVKYGQSLWSIAIAYGTKIDEIKRLNNLTTNDIYLGQKLLIKKVGTATPTIPVPTKTETMPVIQTITPTIIMETAAVIVVTPTLTAEPQTSAKSGGILTAVIIIIALVTAGVGTWLGMKKPV
jgi:LysM repeat protein